MTLAEKLKALRAEKHLTQEDVARSLDITRQAVARWESGANMPSAQKLVELSALYGVPLSELAGGASESAPKPRAIDALVLFAAYALLYIVCAIASERVASMYSVWYWCSRHFVLPLCFAVSVLAWYSAFTRVAVATFAALALGIAAASVWDAAVYPGPAGLGAGFVVVIAAVAAGVVVGGVLERRTGALRGTHKRTRAALVMLLLLLTVLSMYHITSRLGYISGANDGWQAGFDAGLADAREGEEYDASDAAVPEGSDQYSLGWRFCYSSGYDEGWEFGSE